MERTDVRLPEQVFEQVDAMVAQGRFQSRSAVLRHAVQRMPQIVDGDKKRWSKADHKATADLQDLAPENIGYGDTHRLEYVLEKLADADELSRELVWQSELWEGVTVEELLGALIESDWLLESYREQVREDYTADGRIART